MKKILTVAALAALTLTTGCYTSRTIAGDDLAGGPFNPFLWVTVPIDAVLSPIQIPTWLGDETDDWTPFDVDEIREEYSRPELSELSYRGYSR
jgi:hypothetical protein